jgi:hypothetical protein
MLEATNLFFGRAADHLELPDKPDDLEDRRCRHFLRRGVMYSLEEYLKTDGRNLTDISVAIQGFGNVGSNAALLIAEQGGLLD